MAIPIVDMKDLGKSFIMPNSFKSHSIWILIGLGNSSEPSRENFNQVSKELDAAFSSVGFVYLKNHGISQDVVGTLSVLLV